MNDILRWPLNYFLIFVAWWILRVWYAQSMVVWARSLEAYKEMMKIVVSANCSMILKEIIVKRLLGEFLVFDLIHLMLAWPRSIKRFWIYDGQVAHWFQISKIW